MLMWLHASRAMRENIDLQWTITIIERLNIITMDCKNEI